ncbi:hypothetical protein I5168_12015 [Nonlabens sp. SCSIO 43208]|uniref:hypothetical protein n=1 Tax=Nonlabens sp. SCSIO 43208 TaxID=2793009 RepID=UPI003D6C1361
MNIINALIILTVTIVICMLISLLFMWDFIAAHWLRQALVILYILAMLAIGIKVSLANLYINNPPENK